MNGYMTPVQAAAQLHVTVGTLAEWRSKGCGPDYHKLGTEPDDGRQDRRRVRYRQTDIDAYLHAMPRTKPIARR
ncbi:helix-turn-helix transcriptional regulator [Bifidobacterium animalis]|uniref:helix-turn-helix transcriptional regulator n=1 Tax=Bifidobacterium animalis TaxID=28025 RepID=UPI003F909AFB